MTEKWNESRWRCPNCGSDDVQISLPTWYRETRDCELVFVETDEAADPTWWWCQSCNESGGGDPIDANKEEVA